MNNRYSEYYICTGDVREIISQTMSHDSVSIDEVVTTSLISVLTNEDGQNAPYHPDSIDGWSNDTIELITSTLQDMDGWTTTKIIVHVVFCQSSGTGLHASAGAVWDTQRNHLFFGFSCL